MFGDSQQPASSGDHIVWGGLDASLDTSAASVNSSHTSAERDEKKKQRIANRRLSKDEVLWVSASTSDTASNSKSNEDNSFKFREEAAQDAPDDLDAMQAASDREKKKRIMNKKLSKDEAQSMSASASDSDSSDAKSRDPPGSSAEISGTARASWADLDDEPELEDELLGPLPSQGSALHEAGRCKPCLFLYETIGCKNGFSCSFCHYNHNRRSVARQSKGKRDRFRKLVSRMEALEQDSEQEQQPLAVGRVVREGGGGPLAVPGPGPARKNLMSL